MVFTCIWRPRLSDINNNTLMYFIGRQHVCQGVPKQLIGQFITHGYMFIQIYTLFCASGQVVHVSLFMRLNVLTVGIALCIFPGIIVPWYHHSQRFSMYLGRDHRLQHSYLVILNRAFF